METESQLNGLNGLLWCQAGTQGQVVREEVDACLPAPYNLQAAAAQVKFETEILSRKVSVTVAITVVAVPPHVPPASRTAMSQRGNTSRKLALTMNFHNDSHTDNARSWY
jgi:hypothetical protein